MEYSFDTYDEMMSFLNDRTHIDAFIIKSTKEFIANPELDSVDMNVRCVEVGKIFKINYRRSQVKETLNTIMQKLSDLERYETCTEVKELLNKI